jgi:hypothetical protein
VPDDLVTVLSAFATGIGSLATAWFSVKLSRRRSKKDCDERIAELHRSFREGVELEKEHHEHS